MIRITHISVLLAATAAGAVASQPTRGDASIEFIEPVRVAFYERAPRDVAASMRAAVVRECAARRRRDGPHDDHKPRVPENAGDDDEEAPRGAQSIWICDGSLLDFLRGVDVLGNLQQTGFVCNQNGVARNMRFFLQDMLMNNRYCVFVFFDAKANKHFLDGGEAQ
jgi:hypothetical protein